LVKALPPNFSVLHALMWLYVHNFNLVSAKIEMQVRFCERCITIKKCGCRFSILTSFDDHTLQTLVWESCIRALSCTEVFSVLAFCVRAF